MPTTIGGSSGVTFPDSTTIPAASVTTFLSPGMTDTANVLTAQPGTVINGSTGLFVNNTTVTTANIYLPVNTVAPAITGTAKDTQVLTVSTGTWTQSPTSYSYQWKRNGTVNIGTNANTYTCVTADIGFTIKCVVTATNGVGSTAADSNSTATVTANTYTASYLVVAGGGGGGWYTGGGGGAGGLLSSTLSLSIGSVYTATVGGGGSAGNSGASGASGSNSSINSVVIAIGGGGTNSFGAGLSGGSGGGGGTNNNNAGGAGTSGQGNAGGNSRNSANQGGGGGGGAGSAGASSVTDGGNGGSGSASSITGSSVIYAGGGGGGGQFSNLAGSGGSGGGGNGSNTAATASSGSANLGGGGGGGGNDAGTVGNGGSGGSGIVIISVPTANYSGTVTGSPTVTTNGSNKVIKFTSSGTYTA